MTDAPGREGAVDPKTSARRPHAANSVTLYDPAFWATHPDALHEALAVAAGDTLPPPDPPPGLSQRGREIAQISMKLALDTVMSILPMGAADLHPRLTLTVEEAAQRLGISRAFAYEAVRRGEIPHIKIGKRILVPKVALDALLKSAMPPGPDEAIGT